MKKKIKCEANGCRELAVFKYDSDNFDLYLCLNHTREKIEGPRADKSKGPISTKDLK